MQNQQDNRANILSACMEKSVCKHNDEFGRHIIANCNLPTGKAILLEKSFISTTLSGLLTGGATC